LILLIIIIIKIIRMNFVKPAYKSDPDYDIKSGYDNDCLCGMSEFSRWSFKDMCNIDNDKWCAIKIELKATLWRVLNDARTEILEFIKSEMKEIGIIIPTSNELKETSPYDGDCLMGMRIFCRRDYGFKGYEITDYQWMLLKEKIKRHLWDSLSATARNEIRTFVEFKIKEICKQSRIKDDIDKLIFGPSL
jgi:hypothetical protein